MGEIWSLMRVRRWGDMMFHGVRGWERYDV